MKDAKLKLTNVEVRMGLGIALCLLICSFAPDYLQALAGCTALIMVTQGNGKATFQSGLTRTKGVIIGDVVAAIIVGLDLLIGNTYVFFLLAGIGAALNMLACQLFKLPQIVARVSTITYILVVVLAQGTERFEYAVLRLVGTLLGAGIALLLAYLWDLICKKKHPQEDASVEHKPHD